MFKYLLLLCAVSLALSFPGSFKISFSRTEIVADSLPQLADHFQMVMIGSDISISPQLDLIFRGGYGSSEPSVPVEVPDSLLAFEEEGRIWILKAGMDYLIIPQAPFFLRGTAGSAFTMRDYCMGQYEQRYTDGSWESLLSIGLGSEFPVDFIPIISSAEFLLSAEWIGSDVMVITGEIGIGI
ncbi:MAG: hypothetical protein K8S62_00540 [Candidatus Sabulitectum sp.]|nr:hypothetical protein [Candidatus Sabulitectum sp.]